MSIKYIILGYLSWQPMTGYDIKKIIADSETLPWSANNNQLYKALVQLHKEEWVTKTVEVQDGSPNRHIYTATESGLAQLKAWVTTDPEPPQGKNAFLNQLMWADSLDTAALDQLLDDYHTAVGEKLFFLRVQIDQKKNIPQRTPRESYLWDMIYQNWISHYELELKWVRQMRQTLITMDTEQKRAQKREQKA